MSHPPGGPSTPPPPGGPKPGGLKHVEPLDPDSPAGRAMAESISQALAEIRLSMRQREAERRARAA